MIVHLIYKEMILSTIIVNLMMFLRVYNIVYFGCFM